MPVDSAEAFKPGHTGLPPNAFSVAVDTKEVLGQLAGYSSVCWDHPERAGVFRSEEAAKAVEDAYSRLQELEPLYHGEETLFKVYKALVDAGLDQQSAQDAVSQMQNAGIYFREYQ